jgi:deoxyribose-phosphate aldolase
MTWDLRKMPYSNNGDLEHLVEQITDVIVARLNGDSDEQAAMCGCTSECFNRCPERMHRIVDAGAARIGLVLGQTASARDWASLIDHTLLKPEATEDDIRRLCEEAAQFHFASVCVNPTWVRASVCNLRGTGVPVCTVIGFPLGATLPDVKAYEARRAIFDGAREVDMVINIGALKSGDDCAVEHDIRSVVEVAHEYEVTCKVIIETALLTDEEKVRASLAAKRAGADFVKTSTGFAKGGATVADVKLMRQAVGSELGVKASGGVKGLADARQMVEAGATRLGASVGVKIAQEAAGARPTTSTAAY